MLKQFSESRGDDVVDDATKMRVDDSERAGYHLPGFLVMTCYPWPVTYIVF